MQLSTLFLAVIFTSAVIADGSAEWGKGKGEEHHCHHKIGKLQRECDEIFFLERLEGLVANSTALAEATHNNATKIGELQAKASQDAPKLAALKANHTLIVECEILAAEEKLEHDCFELLKLEHFLKFAANFTEVSNQAKNNATRISEIAAEASTSATKLQQLQSNATLVSLCFIVDAHEREKHQCEEIKEAESSKIAARLAELQSNAALVSDCASF
jgi:hypothetical protein